MAKTPRGPRRSLQPQQSQNISIPSAPPNDKAGVDEILNRLEEARKRPAIVYWMTPMAKIAFPAAHPLYDQLKALGPQTNI